MEIELFSVDGAVRDGQLAVRGADETVEVVAHVCSVASRWEFTVNGVAAPLPSEQLLCWWLESTEFRTAFLDPEIFHFDFMPTGEEGERARVGRFLDELAARFDAPVTVAHEHGDCSPVIFGPRSRR